MVSNAVKEVTEQDRKEMLAGFLYGMAKLMFGSVAVGGLSPILLDNEFCVGALSFLIFLKTKAGKMEGKLVI